MPLKRGLSSRGDLVGLAFERIDAKVHGSIDVPTKDQIPYASTRSRQTPRGSPAFDINRIVRGSQILPESRHSVQEDFPCQDIANSSNGCRRWDRE